MTKIIKQIIKKFTSISMNMKICLHLIFALYKLISNAVNISIISLLSILFKNIILSLSYINKHFSNKHFDRLIVANTVSVFSQKKIWILTFKVINILNCRSLWFSWFISLPTLVKIEYLKLIVKFMSLILKVIFKYLMAKVKIMNSGYSHCSKPE